MEINTKNLNLRPPKESDFKFLKNMWENGEVMKYVGFPKGLKQSDNKIEKWIKDWCTPDKLRLIIEDKRSKKPIGETGYRIEKNYLYAKNKKVAALDIKIGNRNFWRKGLATEALQLLINQLKKTSDIDIFEVTPNIKNKAALKLYKKLGFKKVGKVHKFISIQNIEIKYQYMELTNKYEKSNQGNAVCLEKK